MTESILSPESTTIAFIGTGVMGRSMAGHLLEAGCSLKVYNRTRSKADDLVNAGARWCDTPGDAAADARVIITIVGFPEDVEAVYLGAGGIVERAPEGAYLIDMTTSSPELARRIDKAARARGQHAIDAPVSGGDVGAREARLSIMTGGSREDFDAVLPILELMGKNIVLQGPAGSGQHTKMANQIAIAAGMMGVSESLVYAKRAGLDPETVLKSIGSGAAASFSLNVLGPRMIAGDFAPGFYVKHFIKDMRIAIESAEAMNLDLPGLQLARKLYNQLAAEGGEDKGTQALYTLIDR
ncbi:MAG: NAD(P)-dependent oxidoreductase [Verrucomicrobia bacterium]|nr:MAG: NAD(P)-dependent oxidoreductase [Verrucomicrobiota bacterium]